MLRIATNTLFATVIAAAGTAAIAAPATLEAEVERIAPQVDLDAATDAEIAQIRSIVYGGGSIGERAAQIRAIAQ